MHRRSGDGNGSDNNRIEKSVYTRTTIIALLIMLILLLTLQAPVCCDAVVSSELVLPAAVEQPLRSAQPAPAIGTISVPVKVNNSSSIPPDKHTVQIQTSPNTTRREFTQLASAEAVIGGQAVVADVLALDRSTKAQSSNNGQAATDSFEDIQSDAAVTLTAVTGRGYIKIAHSGEALDDNVDKWECVEDKNSRLTWEVKKNDGGIRDRDHSYSWLAEINGERHGISDGGRCKGGVSCDTNSYAEAMNKHKLCGYSDWRLPTKTELESLVEYKNNPAGARIDKKYFPEAIPSWYWTSSENASREGYAWYVLFRNGVALNDLKERPKHIRLVRGSTQQ